ncbi:FAD-binding oxidoreductase [Limnochorda pilosa]|uniref:FAD-binding protein n=1 Tax=Limnochorda pilosa TaxID=1555112 RepID=A0A0K2SPI8_LIMPI|nr:FAD-linked oxidase C-terminal domain-containing protein [Limnochorda pilosa]BAS29053.1 FAD-binding protein [Limnochorda pilosa]
MKDTQLVEALRDAVGSQWVLDAEVDRTVYAYDASPRHRALPDVVVLPASTGEVQAVVRLAAERGVPVVPRGQATNLSGGTVPAEGGIVLSLNRMNRFLELDRENLTATVEPGVITAELHRRVEAEGLFYPPDPGSVAVSTLGGNVAENAGGLRGLKYGVTGDYVIGLEAVLPDGDRIVTGGKNVKDVAGYDLTQLLVGSEGTLGIVTRITVRLLPLPAHRQVALAVYHDLEQAARSVERIIAGRIIPATLEFLDRGTIEAVEAFAHVGLPTDAEALLLLAQDGPEEQVARDVAAAAAICREEGAVRVEVGRTPEEGDRLMAARRAALSALARMRPTTILEDATVPRSRLVEMLRAIQGAAARHRLTICTFGHAGDGNLHPTCLTDERDEEEAERVEAAFEEIFRAAIELGGTITGEHGVGLSKREYLEWKLGPAGVAVMTAIKDALDPRHLLNPGKIFPRSTPRRLVVRQG